MALKTFTLTHSEIALLPSEEDIFFYQQHGWYVSKQLFSDDEIDLLKTESEQFYAGKRDRILPVKPQRVAYWEPAHGDVFRINDYIIYENHTIARILTKPLIGAVAALLAGNDVRVFNTSLMLKPPKLETGKSTVGWHTDRAYWRTCTSDNLLTAWIPLHDTDESIGTLRMLDGSHLWTDQNPQDADTAQHFIRSDLKRLETQLQEQLQEQLAQSNAQTPENLPHKQRIIALKKGQVSFHHCLTYHGSGDNISDRSRWALSLHIQDADNRYRQFPFANGSLASYNSDELCRKDAQGHPDYTDPDIFPALWLGGNPRLQTQSETGSNPSMLHAIKAVA
jgi:hypothetical protein